MSYDSLDVCDVCSSSHWDYERRITCRHCLRRGCDRCISICSECHQDKCVGCDCVLLCAESNQLRGN